MLLGLAAAVLVAAGLAWRDGGREPVHTIVELVPMPQAAQGNGQ